MRKSICLTMVYALFVCALPSYAAGNEFSVVPFGDTSDIVVYEVTGNYDAKLADGSSNNIPRQKIAKEFFQSYPDEYDFLVIFSNFDFAMPEDEAVAFYTEVKNDVQGIGKELVDNSALYGSSGVLQGIIDMGDIDATISDPLNSGFSDTLGTLSHELLHRWAAYIRYKKDGDTLSSDLLGRNAAHWSFLLDTAGSLEYGNRWVDNGNGTFTSLAGRRYFSPLDMYLMGFVGKDEVSPMLLVDNPTVDPFRPPESGVTIEGTPYYVSIDDIIAAEGERIPTAEDSQKDFNIGCILITRPGTYDETDLHEIRNIMQSWPLWFSGLTEGIGKVTFGNDPFAELPENPGPAIYPIDPRVAPPEINEGISWLLDKQLADGSWQDNPFTADRDTATVLSALAGNATATDAVELGVAWFETEAPGNLDFSARKIELFNRLERDSSSLASDLMAQQNSDGGWGSSGKYRSNPFDTALALSALSKGGAQSEQAVEQAVGYLLNSQNEDGGWSAEEHSSVQVTTDVIGALLPCREQYGLAIPITKAVDFLYTMQNPDGGFGNSPSTVYNTALALITFKQLGKTSQGTDKALTNLLDRQEQDGSWQASSYQTALAVKAIWMATRDPDLSVSPADIRIIPENIVSLPSDVTLSVTVHNEGVSDVSGAAIVLYGEQVSDAGKIGETTVDIAGKSSATVTFNATVSDVNPHHYYVVVDPDNLISESSEQNNSALHIVYPDATYDFAILPEDISIAPSVGNIFEPHSVNVRVLNNGTVDAFSVPVQLVADTGSGPIIVATQTANLSAGQSVDVSFSWVPVISGVGVLLSVIVDPHHAFVEIIEDNNSATVTIDINTSSKSDLSLSASGILMDPAPAFEAGSTSFRASVLNRGFSEATDVQLDFYDGLPGENGAVHLGAVVIPAIGTGESSDAQLDWVNIPGSGERKITVVVDRDNLIDEIDESNNRVFLSLQVLSLPDFEVSTGAISFNPEAPREGDPVTVTAIVRNRGEQEAASIPVNFKEEGALVGTLIIPQIEANGQESVSVSLDMDGKIGVTEIEVIVDPDNTILEQDTTNNSAVRKLGVQNANLWLSNKYISPNGDGVKDSTEFGCRLTAVQNVTVVLLNAEGGVVREYSGPDFTGTSYVTLAWDGLDTKGRVVDDGQYQIQVLSESKAVLASLLVTVDNNRSPLSEAIGTDYLFQNNISCDMPDIGGIAFRNQRIWDWFPDESGIIFPLYKYYTRNAPQYSDGIYTMGPDGSGIHSLFPASWKDSEFFRYTYTFGYGALALSPDSYKVAFLRHTDNVQSWERGNFRALDD